MLEPNEVARQRREEMRRWLDRMAANAMFRQQRHEVSRQGLQRSAPAQEARQMAATDDVAGHLFYMQGAPSTGRRSLLGALITQYRARRSQTHRAA